MLRESEDAYIGTHTYPKSACIDEPATVLGAYRARPHPTGQPASTTCQNGMPLWPISAATQGGECSVRVCWLRWRLELCLSATFAPMSRRHKSRPAHGNLGIVAAVSPLADSGFSSRQTDVGRVSCGPDCDPRPDREEWCRRPAAIRCQLPSAAAAACARARCAALRTSAALPRSCRGRPRVLSPSHIWPGGAATSWCGRKPGSRSTHGGHPRGWWRIGRQSCTLLGALSGPAAVVGRHTHLLAQNMEEGGWVSASLAPLAEASCFLLRIPL